MKEQILDMDHPSAICFLYSVYMYMLQVNFDFRLILI